MEQKRNFFFFFFLKKYHVHLLFSSIPWKNSSRCTPQYTSSSDFSGFFSFQKKKIPCSLFVFHPFPGKTPSPLHPTNIQAAATSFPDFFFLLDFFFSSSIQPQQPGPPAQEAGVGIACCCLPPPPKKNSPPKILNVVLHRPVFSFSLFFSFFFPALPFASLPFPSPPRPPSLTFSDRIGPGS